MKLILAALAVVATAAISAAAPPPTTGKSPANPFVAWTLKDESDRNAFNSLVILGDRVVVGTDKGELIAIDAKTGKPAWKHDHGRRIYHAPCGDGDRVYVTSDMGVTAVRLNSGMLDWTYPIKQCDGPVLVRPDTGLVYVGGHDGRVYTLEAKTGLLKWNVDCLADAPKDPPGFDGNSARMDGTQARPNTFSTDGDTVYLTIMDQCRAITFDAKTGKRGVSFQSAGWTWAAPVVTKDRAYLGSQDGYFYAFDKVTGKEVWKYKTKGRADGGGAVDDDHAYFSSSDGTLYCVTLADGKEKWKFTPPVTAGKRKGVHRPIVVRGTVYFATMEGTAHAVAAHTGDVVWTQKLIDDSEVYGAAVTDGTRFFWVSHPSPHRRSEERKGVAAVVAVGVK